MSNFSDFIGGGGSASFPTIFLHNSQTWVPPQDGNIMIHVIGAGGSGGGWNSTPQSGAAGGYCRKNSLAVTTSSSFTVVVGAGGASVIGSYGAGSLGGTTSVSGTGLPAGTPLRAFGGAGGALQSTGFSTGGVATGGDVNYAGGRGGGEIGGGAVGLTGTGMDGAKTADVITNYGGNCDIVGDFYSSSFGQLSGSLGGRSSYVWNENGGGGNFNAGPLAGAGGMYGIGSYDFHAGHASVGGGGGFCRTAGGSTRVFSGRGGEGCVVIQYIP